ncbi:AI-2E family transporter [Corynebacterium sp. 3HC-13]|uniref:AI-2E family transporter n=1 Tax=Corynebacterium poyangense TaxID=2684405 RepID=UPI001CCEA6B1|nr:AI-2E family transporter [Corynebacterium poyangense]MBZ8177298.1 AI-2E family transporter [Corynebacterium poyangense]
MKSLRERLQQDLPYPVIVAAAWSACLILIAGGLMVVAKLLGRISMVLIPLAIALLICAMLDPMNRALHRRAHFSRGMAAFTSEVFFFSLVALAFTLAVERLTSGFRELLDGAQQGINQIINWLENGPLHVNVPHNSQLLERLDSFTRGGTESPLFSGAVKVGTTTADFFAGLLICLIATFFFLYQGKRIWDFLLLFLPSHVRGPTHEAARRGWVSLGSYTRAQLAVAGINAIGIGFGAWILGLPLVIPITVIVYLMSFVPIVGAFLSGFVAVLIAFVDKGFWMALFMLAVVLIVHFIEANVLHPFLMGHAVSVHPLGVIVSVAAGTYLFGFPGALFAVPLVATLNSSVRYLVGQDPFPFLGQNFRPRTFGPPDS